MDLRIDAKKFCAVTLTKKNSPNQMKEYPTPSSSKGSIHSTSSVTISRRYSHSAAKPDASERRPVAGASPATPAKQYLNVSHIALAEFRRKTSSQHRSDTKPSTMILRKLQQLKRASDVGMHESPPRPALVYRTMANFSKIDENAFIRIDEQGFHEKKRLRIQTEDDLLKDENILKKFKPNDFQGLSKPLKTRKDIDLMALLLQSALSNPNFLPQKDSLAWLGYIACLQREYSGNDRNNGRTRDNEARECPPRRNHINNRFKGALRKLRKMNCTFSSFNDKGATTDVRISFKKEDQSDQKPEEPENVASPELPVEERPKVLQENNGQDPVSQKENLELKDIAPAKPQPEPLEFVPDLKKELKNTPELKPLQSVNMIGREVAIKYPHPCKHNPDLYVIGPNGSTIAKTSWENINWDQTPAAITRKILMCLFDKYTLATHSLSGRPSPAFKGIYKAEKMPLHAGKVADTVSIVTSHVNVTAKEVRMAITTKCADECKMLRLRQEKKSKINKEFMEKLGAQQV